MFKRIFYFLRNYGLHQTWLLILDRLFPRRSVKAEKLPDRSGINIRFAVDGTLAESIDELSRDMVDADGEWLLFSSDGNVQFSSGALLRCAAFLKENTACGILYFDSAVCDESGTVTGYELRPDFALEYLRSYDYFGKVIAVRRDFAEKFPGSSNLELMLHGVENGVTIGHLPQVAYTHRGKKNDDDGSAAVSAHLTRCGIEHDGVELVRGVRHIKRRFTDFPLVSILIPSHDHEAVLRRCIDSILQKCTWKNLEIVIVENGSTESALFDYYREIETDPRITVIEYPADEEFNYSRVNNFGADVCQGEYILFLNNDTELISPDFIEEMLGIARESDVGITGAYLKYPDGSVQHCGTIVGMGSIAAHHSQSVPDGETGYLNCLCAAREYSAVTFACAMVRKADFFSIGKLDEALGIAYNDIDFCLRMRQTGKRVVCTPFAKLYHYESLSRGREDSLAKQARIADEAALFEARHGEILECGDPFFNPNLDLNRTGFAIRGRAGRLKLVQRKKRS